MFQVKFLTLQTTSHYQPQLLLLIMPSKPFRMFQHFRSINSSLNHIVKANIFLTDMGAQFGEFNKVYAKYFSEHKPARSCVAVKELPLGVPLEIEVVAIEKDDTKL